MAGGARGSADDHLEHVLGLALGVRDRVPRRATLAHEICLIQVLFEIAVDGVGGYTWTSCTIVESGRRKETAEVYCCVCKERLNTSRRHQEQ